MIFDRVTHTVNIRRTNNMSDVKLTLEPELETPTPGIPTLTLDGVEEEKPVAP